MSSIKYGHFVIFYTEVKLLCQARRLRAGHTRTHARTHTHTHTQTHKHTNTHQSVQSIKVSVQSIIIWVED